MDGMVEASKVLVEQGLRILRKLAADEDNCRVISNAPGLVCKIMAPLTSAKLHGDYHDEWSGIANESMKLVLNLMAAPGTGEVQSQISSNMKAITGVLDCRECGVRLKRRATQTLLDLSVEPQLPGNRVFIWMLLHIFVLPDNCFDTTISSIGWVKKRRCIRRFAGEKLRAGGQSVGGVISDLGTAIAENDAYMVNATDILGDLWAYCSDKYLEQVKQVVLDVMPKVLREILRRPPTRPAADDLENGRDSSHDQRDLDWSEKNIKLKKSLISFCWTIHNTRSEPRNRLDEIANEVMSELGESGHGIMGLLYSAERRIDAQGAV